MTNAPTFGPANMTEKEVEEYIEGTKYLTNDAKEAIMEYYQWKSKNPPSTSSAPVPETELTRSQLKFIIACLVRQLGGEASINSVDYVVAEESNLRLAIKKDPYQLLIKVDDETSL